MPSFVEPQVPVLVSDVPAGPDWVHEIKYGGYRILAFIERGTVRLISHRRDWSARFPSIAAEMDRFKASEAILDGEIAAPDEQGVTRLADMRSAMPREPERLAYYLFDLLWQDGEDLRPMPLLERKRRLKRLPWRPAPRRILYSEHVPGPSGPVFYAEAAAVGCEGVVSKRVDAPYKSGPSRTWRKIKSGGVPERQAELAGRALRRRRPKP